jgi:putative hydrolase of the HAD superfamily
MGTPMWVFFDLGGTVLDAAVDPLAPCVALLARSRNPHGVTPEEVQKVADELDVTFFRLKGQSPLESHIHAYNRLLCTLVRIEPEGTPEELELCVYDAAFRTHPTEGLMPALLELKDMGVRKGIISNVDFSGSTICRELDRQGLRGHFEHVICSSDYGLRKPYKMIFDVALLKAECKPVEAWYVGDTFEHDVVGAAGAGLRAVWYNPTRKAKPRDVACLEIHSWSELPGLIREGNA